MTIPFDGIPLAEHREWFEELVALGYTDVWSSEADGTDGFTPLALAAAWTPSLRLGLAIMPAFTRAPAVLAQSVAALAEAAPGRFAFGIGTSSDVIVERWNGIPFVEPYKRPGTRCDSCVRPLPGRRSTRASTPSPSRVSAWAGRRGGAADPGRGAAPGMLRLAGREGDGAIINWLSADDVTKVVAEVGAGKEIVARIFVYPSDDAEAVRAVGRRMIAAYLNVAGLRRVSRVAGPGTAAPGDVVGVEGRRPQGRPGRHPGRGGRRPGPLRLAAEVRAEVRRYVDNGVTTPALALFTAGLDLHRAITGRGPANREPGRAGPQPGPAGPSGRRGARDVTRHPE